MPLYSEISWRASFIKYYVSSEISIIPVYPLPSNYDPTNARQVDFVYSAKQFKFPVKIKALLAIDIGTERLVFKSGPTWTSILYSDIECYGVIRSFSAIILSWKQYYGVIWMYKGLSIDWDMIIILNKQKSNCKVLIFNKIISWASYSPK